MKIALYGHFGTLNTGNEGTLLAAVSYLRGRSPDDEFTCICTDPVAVVKRLGIAAVPISSRQVRLWDRRADVAWRLRMALAGAIEEVSQWVGAFRTLRGTDVFVVPGTGVLTDAYGLSGWGPYNLWKWSLMAKMRGCRVRFLSVGAGPIYGRLGRFLIRSALWTADDRSYRDRPSMECAKRLGLRTDRDHVRPDLAFSLSPTLLPRARETRSGRRVVGLGLMLYAGRYSAADPDPSTYPTYLNSLALFVGWLLESDYDIRLLLGDEDPTVIGEFRSVLKANLGTYDETRITDAPMLSVEEVLAQLAAVDVVVATRFHNLVFSLLLNRPVVAISFHHKCTSLMKDIGLGAYCHDIHDMNVERLLEQFQSLEDNADTVRRTIAAKVDEYRSALDAQYESLVRGI